MTVASGLTPLIVAEPMLLVLVSDQLGSTALARKAEEDLRLALLTNTPVIGSFAPVAASLTTTEIAATPDICPVDELEDLPAQLVIITPI
jgi:hypothetical protein